MKMDYASARLHAHPFEPPEECTAYLSHHGLGNTPAHTLEFSHHRSAAFSGIERLVDSDLPSARFPSLLDFLTGVDFVRPHCPAHT